ncbi:ABC transporter ATP-binding protein [Draconibacterium sp.]|nr:ABC transporter ATP-binding protein [Draconibacterium sp.]
MVKKIEASNLCLKYGKHQILNKVNVSITSGKITALIGPNGAGKSSVFRVLAGLVKPESGKVCVDGSVLIRIEHLRKYCGYMLESPGFYNYLSGKKNLELLTILTGSGNTVDDLLQLVGLTHEARKKVEHYSRGMKQRLGFAQALINNPDFLILDEPFNGLDPEVKEQMLHYLITLKNKGKGILVSTHLLEDIENIADDFVLLNKGQVFMAGSMQSNSQSRQNVTLYFSKPLPELPGLKRISLISSDKIQLIANIEETEELLVQLLNMGLVPYRIVRSSELHDKYMEIAL